MKKCSLLIIACFIAATAIAQERQVMSLPNPQPSIPNTINSLALHQLMQNKFHADAAHKTTSPGSRWYSYPYAIDTVYYVTHHAYGTAVGTQTLWKDTSGLTILPLGAMHNIIVSQADVLEPQAPVFNTASVYTGEIYIRPTDAYTCDSAMLYGIYHFNNAKTSVVDTLRLMFTTGNGGAIGVDDIWSGSSMGIGGHYGTIPFLDVTFDSVHERGTGSVAGKLFYEDIYLTSADWGDTDLYGVWNKEVAINSAAGISVPAGGMLGMTISFISGDPAAYAGVLDHATSTPPYPAGDTLITNIIPGSNLYNVWEPLIDFYGSYIPGIGAVPGYPPYDADDYNAGYWKYLPNYSRGWEDEYIPIWAWQASGGASMLQFPEIGWHIICPTCLSILPSNTNKITIVNSINAYPDPAIEELNIAFDLARAADISVCLTNIVGQVEATQHINNVTTGKAVFNTSRLPPGMYFYMVQVNNERSTGRVVITH